MTCAVLAFLWCREASDQQFRCDVERLGGVADVGGVQSALAAQEAVERSMPISSPHALALMPMFSRWVASNLCGALGWRTGPRSFSAVRKT